MILGRMMEAREEVCEEAEVVHSARMVLLWAMQELMGRLVLGILDSNGCVSGRERGGLFSYYSNGVAGVDEDAMVGMV